MTTKYIEFDVNGKSEFVFFRDAMQHKDIARLSSYKAVSAGFARTNEGNIDLYGESLSLGIRSRNVALNIHDLKVVADADRENTVFAVTNTEVLEFLIFREMPAEVRDNGYGDKYIRVGRAIIDFNCF